MRRSLTNNEVKATAEKVVKEAINKDKDITVKSITLGETKLSENDLKSILELISNQ